MKGCQSYGEWSKREREKERRGAEDAIVEKGARKRERKSETESSRRVLAG